MTSFEETKQLLENSTFYYIITTNMEGRYTYVNNCYNEAFRDIHGCIVGQPYEVTMHSDDCKVCEEVALQCFTNPACTFPATIRKHDGKGGYLITQWEYKAILDEDGNPAGMFCLGYDITDYTAYHEQLQDAKSLLQEISFYQSHVVRRPLANIMGLAKVLENMPLDQNVRNICKMLIENSLQLDAVIKEAAARQLVD
ncbi:PAS domain-containing protein [Pontibacter sp. JH31]|uniref:histidine kinase n=1 Tax=Pontibacter aquaedesilientis TaxID=2766980 RepID=A0ABR7XFP1_9BACT|nr:PAS domain-containing protein [Pontibacter aquaedesilientis]MBD1397089.1 PAS domain-containing protein [Pontibacter aquaedesilientis]